MARTSLRINKTRSKRKKKKEKKFVESMPIGQWLSGDEPADDSAQCTPIAHPYKSHNTQLYTYPNDQKHVS